MAVVLVSLRPTDGSIEHVATRVSVWRFFFISATLLLNYRTEKENDVCIYYSSMYKHMNRYMYVQYMYVNARVWCSCHVHVHMYITSMNECTCK